jgi:hypothetical protein
MTERDPAFPLLAIEAVSISEAASAGTNTFFFIGSSTGLGVHPL